MLKIVSFLVLGFNFAFGQHFSASIGKSGLSKVINSALESYSLDETRPTFEIPAQTSHLKISKEEINNYSIVSELRKYVNIDLSKDFNYFIKWSPMTIEFNLKKDAFDYDFKGSSQDFTLIAKGVVDSVSIKAARFEICETLNKRCIKDKGVYADIRNISIELSDRNTIEAIVALNIKNTKDKALVSNTGLISSLFNPTNKFERGLYSKFNIKQHTPKLNIRFSEIIIPAPILRVGNREVKLDTSGLKNVILSQKDFLASQLLHIVGRFISEDLSQIVTTGIIGDLSQITKKIKIFDFKSDVFVGPVLRDESDLLSNTYSPYTSHNTDVSNEMLKMVLDMITHSQVDLEYLVLRSSKNESIAFDYNIHAKLNSDKLETSNRILNSSLLLSKPEFSQVNIKYDLALAISESFLNGVLDLASDSGIISKIFSEKANVAGLSVNSVKVHFDQKINQKINLNTSRESRYNDSAYREREVRIDNTRVRRPVILENKVGSAFKDVSRYNTGTATLVANLKLDLSKVPAEGYGARFENFVASTLESKIVWFPLELTFRPLIKVENNRVMLSLKFNTAKYKDLLVNTYNYPMKDMYEIVEKGIVKNLKKDLFENLNNEIRVDITDYIKLPGLQAKAVGVEFLKSGHIALMLNVENLILKELVDYIGGNEWKNY